MPTDFVKNLDKFRIGGKTLHGSEVTDHPRERLMSESGIFNDPHVTEEDKEEFFMETLDADDEETKLNSERRSNIMDRFTEDRSARGIIERKENREMAFEAFNASMRSQGRPEQTREEFDSGFTPPKNKQEGLQFVSKGKIRPPKPTLTDRIRTIEAKKGFSGIVKKETKFMVGEDGAEFVEVIPLQNDHRPVMDLGLNLGFKLGKTTRTKKVVDFDFFNEPKKKQATRSKKKQDFDFFGVY